MTLHQNPQTLRDWRTRSKPLGRSGGAVVIAFPAQRSAPARDTIPRKVRRLVAERDMSLCVYTGKPAEHIHHRRLKQMGGSSDEHASCPCNLVSLTWTAHEFVHRNRFIALAEGLIVPRATPLPGLLPVLVHGYEDGSRARAWPTCTGEWQTHEPDGGGDVA